MQNGHNVLLISNMANWSSPPKTSHVEPSEVTSGGAPSRDAALGRILQPDGDLERRVVPVQRGAAQLRLLEGIVAASSC